MKKVFNKKMNLKKIILLLVIGLVIPVMADSFCGDLGRDCDYLYGIYCNGDTVIEQGGYCYCSPKTYYAICECRSHRISSKNCNDYDNPYQCYGNQIWAVDGYCLEGSCKTDRQFIDNCDYRDNLYCEDNFIVGRDWYCSGGACNYKEVAQNCDDGKYCNGQETCKGAVCVVGTPINCDDEVNCTVDSCNEAKDSCNNIPNNAKCDDGKYCNGQETCDPVNDCQPGTSVDCSANNLPEIADCNNNLDNNPFTWDYASAFISTCDEANDRCTIGTLIHECRDNNSNDGINGNTCGAECDQDTDCGDSNPITVDICGNDCICKHLIEICDNGKDDEGDGLIDCKDPDCAGQQANNVICCQNDDNCNQLDDECAYGVCTNNRCQQKFKPTTDVCRQKNGDCDLEEKCAGNNAKCPADKIEPTTKVCRSAASNCDVTENCDGTTKTCPPNAFKPLGTDCGKCAECDGLGNCNVYDETQDIDCACPADECTDANNDKIIDAYNDYEIGECQSINTCKNCGPTITEPDAKCKTIMKIPIDKGVSMFSLPLKPETPKTFNDIQSGCAFTNNITQGIAYWDPLKPEEKKYVYIDANTILYPGQGYFTTQENECDFTIEGYRFSVNLLGYLGTDNIYNGWNMIGASSEIVNNFDLVEGTCSITSGPWGFDAADYDYIRTQKLEPGKGYFVKTTNDCNLG